MSRDYKDEYKKFQSSTKMKKYRAKLNKYNRNQGKYGNGDGKDASHKNGKISGYESESTNRGRKTASMKKKSYKNGGMTAKQIESLIAAGSAAGLMEGQPTKGWQKKKSAKATPLPDKGKDKIKKIGKAPKKSNIKAIPTMKKGGEVYKKTGKGSKLEKKVVKGVAKGFEKFEKVMGIDPSNTDKQDLGVMGGAMAGGAAGSSLGPLGALAGIVGGARAGKKLMTKKKKAKKEMKKGGRVVSSSAGSNIKKTKKGYEIEQVIKADTPGGPRYYKGSAKSRTEHMAGERAYERAKTKVHSAPADSMTTKQFKTNWDSKTGRKKSKVRKVTDKFGITKKDMGGHIEMPQYQEGGKLYGKSKPTKGERKSLAPSYDPRARYDMVGGDIDSPSRHLEPTPYELQRRKRVGRPEDARLLDLYRERAMAEGEAPGTKRSKSIQNVIDIEEGTYKKTSPKAIAKAKSRRKKITDKAAPTEMKKGGKVDKMFLGGIAKGLRKAGRQLGSKAVKLGDKAKDLVGKRAKKLAEPSKWSLKEGGAVRVQERSVHKSAGDPVTVYQASNSNYKEGK